MTHQLFLGEPSAVAEAVVGSSLLLDGDEGRHAAAVVRLRPGERYFVADGAGRRLLLEADRRRPGVGARPGRSTSSTSPSPRRGSSSSRPSRRVTATSRPIEAATELGVDEVVPWQAERSVVVWRGDRAAKSLAKWVASWPGRPSSPVGRVCRRRPPWSGWLRSWHGWRSRRCTLVLHEDATEPLATVDLPESGDVLVVVGPEGGITDREIEALTAAGAACGAARVDDPARVVSRSRCPRGPQRARPLDLTAYPDRPPFLVRGDLDTAVPRSPRTGGGGASARREGDELLRHREPSLALVAKTREHVGACRQRLLRRERVRTAAGAPRRRW